MPEFLPGDVAVFDAVGNVTPWRPSPASMTTVNGVKLWSVHQYALLDGTHWYGLPWLESYRL